jgi:hypothetical protein
MTIGSEWLFDYPTRCRNLIRRRHDLGGKVFSSVVVKRSPRWEWPPSTLSQGNPSFPLLPTD